MNTPDHLSPEERALARLLGRPAAAAPAPRIDAAITALARQPAAAVPATPTAPAATPHLRHRRRRGVVPVLAVAASLVLVVGLAWQLRPTPPALELPVLAEALPPPTAAPLPAADTPAAEMTIAPVPPAGGVASPTTAPPPRASAASDGTARAERARKESAPAIETGAEKIAPPSPPAPPAPPSASLPQAIAPPAPIDAAPARLAAAPAPAPVRAEPAAPAATATSPELDADAALPPRQWLQRIRQRHEEGDDEGARASLRHFVEAHPKARIPRDLRPLLEDS